MRTIKNKNAVSALVATVLLILITIAAVGIIWGAIMPMLNRATELSQACINARLSIDTTSGYTCYDKGKKQVSVMIARGAEEFELAGIKVGLSSDGTVKTYDIRPSSIDSFTKLLLHMDGSDGSATFTDATGKEVTNPESYDTNTKLMLHMEGSGNSFVDSAAGKTVAANGDAAQTAAQYKMGSKSGVFDGNGDYLSLPDSADWDFGAGDFTIDLWVKRNTIGVDERFVWRGDAAAAATVSFFMLFNTDNQLESAVYSGSTGYNLYSTVTITDTNWHHVAMVRNGINLTQYIDGVASGTRADLSTISVNDLAYALTIGAKEVSGGYANYFNGWIDELRVSKGIARWTGDFAPPAYPYGRVITSTSQKKFGTASGLLDGTGNYLTVPDSADWDFGSGNFTIDTWIRFNDLTDWQDIITQSDGTGFWRVSKGTAAAGNYLYLETTNAAGSYTGRYTFSWVGVATNTWYHLAFERVGTSAKFFIDGVSKTLNENTAFGTNIVGDFSAKLKIGTMGVDGSETGFFNGWIDEFRVSKGIARWTANFAVPTSEYTDASNIRLPQQNEANTFMFSAENITEATIAPIVKVGNTEKVCGISGKVQVPKCA